MTTNNDIGNRIKMARIAAGLNQSELARRIGISRSSMSSLESGESKAPKASTLLKIAAVLDANAHWLLTGQGDPKTPSASSDADLITMMMKLTPQNRSALQAAALALLASQNN
jgi:transcriptional regulator with XRE-family HTH domain